jgi:hypothetical protein
MMKLVMWLAMAAWVVGSAVPVEVADRVKN